MMWALAHVLNCLWTEDLGGSGLAALRGLRAMCARRRPLGRHGDRKFASQQLPRTRQRQCRTEGRPEREGRRLGPPAAAAAEMRP